MIKKSVGDPQLGAFMQGMKDREKNLKANLKLEKLNPLVQDTQVKAVVSKIGNPAERVSDVKLTSNEPEGMVKQISDLTAGLKSLFFENKQIQKNIQDLDKKRSYTDVQLERLMKEKQLIKINGVLQAQQENVKMQKVLN